MGRPGARGPEGPPGTCPTSCQASSGGTRLLNFTSSDLILLNINRKIQFIIYLYCEIDDNEIFNHLSMKNIRCTVVLENEGFVSKVLVL